jgi:hypothetical protein
MEWTRATELETEQALAKQNITNTQSNLEKQGMTFSWKWVEELGTDWAYAAPGQANVVTPFAGIAEWLMQGKVGQSNRLVSTSTAARYASSQQALGRKAEDYLGTAGASGLWLNYTPAWVNLTGSLAEAKETKSAGTLQGIIDQWRAKQENLKNT